MKHYLFYLILISLGTLTFTSSSPASPGSERPKLVASSIPSPAIAAPAALTNVPQTAPSSSQAPVATPNASTQPTAPTYPSDHNTIMAQAGIAPSDFYYVDYIVSRESGWCSTKWEGEAGSCPGVIQDYYGLGLGIDFNLTSKGYGECQSTPAIKMSAIAADWQTNPVTQLAWCSSYATSRYGGWYGAYLHWINKHNW